MKPTEEQELSTITSQRTKTLALIVTFAALAVVLNLVGPKIPYPFAPYLFFQFWEVPIVVAFLLIGYKAGILVSVINTLILFAVFPGGLPTGPLYNFAAVISMMLGVYLPYLLATRRCKTENLSSYLKKHAVLFTLSATALGTVTRVLVMTVVNYFALQQDFPIGLSMPQPAVIAFLPFGALFNAIIAVYTIPLAIGITIAVVSRVKIQ